MVSDEILDGQEQVKVVFVDFENVLMSSSLALEETLASWRGKGFGSFMSNLIALSHGKYEMDFSLRSLPYSSSALSMLTESYEDYEIVLVANQKHETYVRRALDELSEGGLFVSSCRLYETQGEKERIVTSSPYICGSLTDLQIIRNSPSVSFLLPLNLGFIMSFFVKKHITSRSTVFFGFFSTAWKYLAIIWPITAAWPAMFQIHGLNLHTIMGSFLSSIVWISFMHLSRTLREIDRERSFTQEMITPLCAKDFIYDGSSLRIALAFVILYFLLGLLILVKYPLGSLVGLSMGITYFVFLLSPWRTLAMVATAVLTEFLVQPQFTLLFIKRIFC